MARKTTTSAADPLMTPLTFKDVIQHASLDKQARQLAVRGQPVAGHPGLTTAESDVVDLFESRITQRAARLDAETVALTDATGIFAAEFTPDPRLLQQRAIDGVNEVFTARTPTIRQTLDHERTTKAMLTAWKDEHDIARPARYPKSRMVHFRWVPAVMGIEALLSASMLLPATPDGLMGAAALGLAIAALTTGLGLAIGWGALRVRAATAPQL